MLTTIAKSTQLSEEVISNQVYGVIQLYKVLEAKPALEKRTEDVFARTYLTEALKDALNQIGAKFTGEDARGSIVFTGGYGSGKSHQLLALYHALAHSEKAARWLKRQGYTAEIPPLHDPTIIVLHTARTDYDNLWEPVFQQLDAQDVLDQVKRYPTIPQIRQAIGDRHVVIIIDEIENWYETILPAQVKDSDTSRAANRTFLQHLLEVSNEADVSLMVLFSLIRDTPDIVDIIDRTGPVSINLSTAADREEILLYRLFASIDQAAAKVMVDRFIQLYRERNISVPMGDYDAYRARMLRVFPLHPELLRILFERYSTASNYANTRGLLYLLSTILRERADKVPLLLASDVDAARFDDQLTVLDRPLVEATARDIERVSHIDHGREILSTILLYSINREQKIGAEEGEIVMGAATPEVNPNSVLLGLNRLLGRAWHLHKLNGRYAVRIEENVFAVVQNRAREVAEDDAIARIAEVLAKKVLGGNTYVYELDEIPEDRHLKVIVSLQVLNAEQDVYDIYHGRKNQNRMVVLAPFTGDIRKDQGLIDKARRIIGGEAILEEVSAERAKKVRSIINEELDELKKRISDRYGFWHKVSVRVSTGPEGERVETESVRKVRVEADAASLLQRAVSDDARVREQIRQVLHARGASGLRADVLYNDFYMLRRYPTVSEAAQITAALKMLCKAEQVYIEGHKGKDYFGEPFYGLDEHAKAMLYHADFAEIDRGEDGSAEEVKVVSEREYPIPDDTTKISSAKDQDLLQTDGLSDDTPPQVIIEQLEIDYGGRHPRSVAGKFEAALRQTDTIRRVRIEMSNDFQTSGKTDKLERVLREVGVAAEEVKLEMKLDWDAEMDRQTFLQQLLALPTTPGGSLYVIAYVDRIQE
jgi:hypothetical protein